MKKIVLAILFVSSIFAQNIKTGWFAGIEGGRTTTQTNDVTDTFFGIKLGTHFYDKNIYAISNRVYGSLDRVTQTNSDFYKAQFNVDWIFNSLDYIKPFIGANLGYIYFNDNTNDTSHSTGTYGFQTGLLFYIGDIVELEIGAKLDYAVNDNTFWQDTLKSGYASLNFSF